MPNQRIEESGLTGGTLAVAPAPRLATPAARAWSFLDAALNAYADNGPRLAQSYTDEAGLFSTAFVYDNALALLAYVADGRPAALARARALGDALLFAQCNDPEFDDGRLRQAYNVGPYTSFDGSSQRDGLVGSGGKANIAAQLGFLGTAVGDMAWAGIALIALARATRTRAYGDAAVRVGEWIETRAHSGTALGGYVGGVDRDNQPLNYTSTEHNIDCVAFFGQLARFTGDRVWRKRRDHAASFLTWMWSSAERFFYTGTDDGVNVNPAPIPEDIQSWSYLALDSSRFQSSVDWGATRLSVVDTQDGLPYEGVAFSTAGLVADEDSPIAPFQPQPKRCGVWFEGNGHLAAALNQRRHHGDEALARRLLAACEAAQDRLGAGQTMGGHPLPERAGVVSSSAPIDTGYGWGYYPYRHVGTTAWYLLANARANPLAA